MSDKTRRNQGKKFMKHKFEVVFNKKNGEPIVKTVFARSEERAKVETLNLLYEDLEDEGAQG
ncbi:hypothetical protein [Neobacillus niacini]|uniref:hypothetical protein n=1 Tax=Neobacillus niacini TaxID=86668 RepID=UPI00203C0ACB|nr:hypothetical protein [Neobacillus niacini]MCM3692197.1 hypothetical protein [Neobacillus niacini]